MKKRIMRGVQDIRTLSGRADEGTIPYKAYMKLSILEMEKFRRGKEKQSALERVHHIDQRFLDIEAARQEIFSALEAKGIRRLVPTGPSGTEMAASGPEAAPRTTTGPFKIRY
jgi:hypothetical protein